MIPNEPDKYDAPAVITPQEAVRDEGVSYHYVPAEEPVEPTDGLVEALDAALSAAGFETPRGPTWTTSAMYRETVREVERYQAEGVLTLCVESAALWAVCAYRGAAAATVHEVGDYLGTDEWVPDTGGDRGLVEMLEPTVTGLERFLERRSG